MIVIKELEIKNCLSLSHVLLHFEYNNYSTIFNCASAYKLKDKLIHAIQPFFCKDMISLTMEGKHNIEHRSSYVRIKFLMHKDKDEGSDVVDAMRLSAKPNQILYYFNEEQYIDPIQVFHERCQIDVSSFCPFLNEIFSNENKNLMNKWFSSKCPLRFATEKSFESLADYLETARPHSQQQLIARLSQTNLLIDREYELIKRRTFVVVANEIGRIFNYITFEEYNVKFFIPLSAENLNIRAVEWKDISLNKIETRVKRTGGQDPCVWNQLEPGLKKLLEISRIIASAKYLNQKFIFIEDTTLIQEYQTQEMIKEAIIQKTRVNTKAVWQEKNFIKRIVDVCNEIEIAIFINYHGLLHLNPTQANIIKCRDSYETGGQSIYVCSNLQPMDLDDFLTLASHRCN